MSMGRVLTSLVIRGALSLLVVAAMRHSTAGGRKQTSLKCASPQSPSFLRACFGFVTSLAITVSLMIGLSAPASLLEPPPWTLRGSIAAE